jgi:hypothetical protein
MKSFVCFLLIPDFADISAMIWVCVIFAIRVLLFQFANDKSRIQDPQ